VRDDSESKEGVVTRWSRLKTEARKAEQPTVSPPIEQAPAERGQGNTPPVPPKPKTDADMPPLESLDQDAYYGDFLSPGVSEALRRLALRKLFHASKFNVVDGLDDCCANFAGYEPLGDRVTSDMRHALEQKARRGVTSKPDAELRDASESSLSESVVAADEETDRAPQSAGEPEAHDADQSHSA
jgi:Protein of unknown function (DUF3306).